MSTQTELFAYWQRTCDILYVPLLIHISYTAHDKHVYSTLLDVVTMLLHYAPVGSAERKMCISISTENAEVESHTPQSNSCMKNESSLPKTSTICRQDWQDWLRRKQLGFEMLSFRIQRISIRSALVYTTNKTVSALLLKSASSRHEEVAYPIVEINRTLFIFALFWGERNRENKVRQR